MLKKLSYVGKKEKFKLVGDDQFDLKTPTSRLMRAARLPTLGFVLIGAFLQYVEATVKGYRSHPVFHPTAEKKLFLYCGTIIEQRFYQYLDLIPVYPEGAESFDLADVKLRNDKIKIDYYTPPEKFKKKSH